MDTNTLSAFVTVAEQGSFSAAADRLYLTQSAVSKRVAQLEDQLGNRLFDRIGRNITLTEAGHALLPRARQILLQLDDARRAIGNLSGTIRGRLSVAASHHISMHRLPPILRTYSQQYPDVELDLRFAESEVAYDGVMRGELELALITLSPVPDANILSQAIWQDKLCYVVAKDHPLAGRGKVALRELTAYKAILPDEQTFTHQLVQELFDRHKLALNSAMSTNYMDTIRMMVSIGLGWSLLPETMIGDELTELAVDAEISFAEGVVEGHNLEGLLIRR